MSEAAAQEPTMEEILASIRRIISEDESPVADLPPEPEEEAPAPVVSLVPEPEPPPAVAPPAVAPSAAAPPAAVAPAPAPVLATPAKEEVLELTQRVEPEPAAHHPASAPQSLGDLDFSDADVAPATEPAPAPTPPPRQVESLVSDKAANAAASHFGALSQSLLMPAAGRTLEDVVKELMKPMLKAWLDENLPSITEAAVRTEVERISRRGG